MPSETDRWKSLDAASYDGVAEQFEKHGHQLAQHVAERVVALADLKDGERALDVGTGTGIVPFEVARVAHAGSSILGVDISTGMIEAARRNALRDHLHASRVDFQQMDAESLSLADGGFDVVTSMFALGHIPNPDRAVAEMYRVLRPGGRLLIAVGSRPPLLSLSTLTHAGAELRRRARAIRGLRLSADLLDQIVERHAPADTALPTGSTLATQLSRSAPIGSLMRSAGFERLHSSWRNYQNAISSAEQFWEMQCTICTRARKRLLDAPEHIVSTVKDEFMQTCQRTLQRGGDLVFPISAVFVQGRKPLSRSSA